MKNVTSWDDLWTRILMLWPRWKPNDEQIDCFRDELGHLDLNLVYRACRQVATNHPRMTPSLPFIKTAIREIRPQTRTNSKHLPYHESLRARWSREAPQHAAAYANMTARQLLTLEAWAIWQKREKFYGPDDPITLDARKRWKRLLNGTEPLENDSHDTENDPGAVEIDEPVPF